MFGGFGDAQLPTDELRAALSESEALRRLAFMLGMDVESIEPISFRAQMVSLGEPQHGAKFYEISTRGTGQSAQERNSMLCICVQYKYARITVHRKQRCAMF